MPFYILSSVSCIKNNEYKVGYSCKNKDELLNQYEKNKRVIANPFILQWWNIRGSLKDEKKIHNILFNTNNIENISGEWYKCYDLLYFLKTINTEINNMENKNEKDDVKENIKNVVYELSGNNKYYNSIFQILIRYKYILDLFNVKEIKMIQKYRKKFNKIVFIENNIEYIRYDFLIIYIKDNEFKYEKHRKSIMYEINKGIKDHIININIQFFNNFIKTLDIKRMNKNNFPVINISDYVDVEEIEIEPYYIDDIKSTGYDNYVFMEKFELSSKKYIQENEKTIYKILNKRLKNNYFVIKRIYIDKINIKIQYNKNHLELSINEYKEYIDKNIEKNINCEKYGESVKIDSDYYMCFIKDEYKKKFLEIYNSKIIKTSKVLYYSFDIGILDNNTDKTEKTYKLLDLDNENISKLILEDKIYSNIIICLNNECSTIKKYLLYQLLYFNK